MGRGKSLTLERRHEALGMLQTGMHINAVARAVGVSHSTISRLQARFLQTGQLQDRPRFGAPKKTTHHQDRYTAVTSRRNRFYSARKLFDQLFVNTGKRVSVLTIRNRLHARGLRARRPYVTLGFR